MCFSVFFFFVPTNLCSLTKDQCENFTPFYRHLTILYFVGLVQISLQCVPRVLVINVRAQSLSYYRDRITITCYSYKNLYESSFKKIYKKQINGLILDSRRRINIINIQILHCIVKYWIILSKMFIMFY